MLIVQIVLKDIFYEVLLNHSTGDFIAFDILKL